MSKCAGLTQAQLKRTNLCPAAIKAIVGSINRGEPVDEKMLLALTETTTENAEGQQRLSRSKQPQNPAAVSVMSKNRSQKFTIFG